MEGNTAIRILIADDHPVVRDGLGVMLETQADFKVVSGAADGQATLEKTASFQPDVVLLDLEMPGMDGVAVLEALSRDFPAVAVIVFTAYDTDERIIQAVRAGARGYLLKGVPREQLFEAIRTVHAGGSLLQPLVAKKLMQHVAAETQASHPPIQDALTNREQEILRELSTGKTNKEIARGLFISERTVKFHVSSILRKLGVSNRTEAVKTAVQRGLINW